MLSEEIEEKSKEGEILLAMDANAKIGVLNEVVSRNGKLLLDVLKHHDLTVMNTTDKCIGSVTRQNTANSDEKSAIDFIIANSFFNRVFTYSIKMVCFCFIFGIKSVYTKPKITLKLFSDLLSNNERETFV